MTARKILRRIHLVATIWFALCTGFVLLMTVSQLGFRWRLVFSLPGHSFLGLFVLIGLYVLVFFRGFGCTQHVIQAEHPLTSTPYYKGFYASAPLLGALAGVIGMMGVADGSKLLFGIALATIGTTFLVWIVIDPLVGTIETLLPASRRHRAERVVRGR